MKPATRTPLDRARLTLATGLAALLTVTSASGQAGDSDAMRRLQEENAALRKQLAAMESKAEPAAPAAAQAAAPAAARPSLAAEPSDSGVMILTPFEVKSDKDYGYLKTNSATATRIGTDIQKIPLNISIVSEDFIKDANFKDIQDVLRYQSSSAGDTRMNISVPATTFTPSGNLSMRGFPNNSRLRNGLLRYSAYSLDNVERVEIIKGSSAVFFGRSFPGGVINYVTKQPSFSKIPTSVSFSYGGYDERIGDLRVTLDTNQVFSDKAAMRIVGAWDNGVGDARFEYEKGYSLNAGLTLIPLKSGKLRIAIEADVLQKFKNNDDTSWSAPQGWFDAYKTPPANLIAIAGAAVSGAADPAAAYRARIFNNLGQWIADVRNAAGDPYIPLYTQQLQHGAYYTDKAGNRIHDEKFNYYGSGTYTKDQNSTFAIVTDFAATDWLDVRYSYTSVNSRFSRVFSSAAPYADGVRFAVGTGGTAGYETDAHYHQADLVLKKKFGGVDNKLLLGGLMAETYHSYDGSNAHGSIAAGQLFPFFGYLPGAYDKPDEGYVSPIPAAFRQPVLGWGPAQQYIRDRNGKILTPQEIFSLYDPGVHVNPDIRRITEITRGLVDHSRPSRKEWYANWQGTALQDRLTMFVGYRKEETSDVGQIVTVNGPWYGVSDYALQNIPQSDWLTYGLSEVFSRSRVIKGDAKMAGFSYEIKKNISLYASYSLNYSPSGVATIGGDSDPNNVKARATLLGLNPTTEYARVLADGFLTDVPSESGKNAEFGVKIALNDNKLVGTLSVYRVTRLNRNLDDTQRQLDEPLNYQLPNKAGAFSRVIRWYTASANQENEGAEFEAIWTPKRNYQAVISGGWMWRSETLSDPTLSVPTAVILRTIVFGNRLPYAPEFRFNIFNKYTFDRNFIGEHGRGLSIGLGARYSSEIIIGNDQNTNAARGGLTAGNYTVFDTVFSYPIEVMGYKMSGSLNINNLLDKDYSEGGFNLSPPRSYMFTLGMKF